MLIRQAAPGDALEVARVHVRAWQIAYRGLLPDAALDGLRPEDRAARYAFGDPDPKRPATLVAADDVGAIRGFATIGGDRDGGAAVGELWALYVDPDAWARGFGRALVAAARARLCDLGCERALLWVLQGNVRAGRFYRADGWSPDGARRTEAICGIDATELRYTRLLP